ncbi:MAG TPA: hypothetical protein VMB50_10025 [Myxococcales bacterium]|nr:hypothetical protein [Myxococcales bacterium]
MTESFTIDLDSERVAMDGAWYSKEDLARKIKEMVDGGDFRVARPSAALEALEQAIASLATLTVRLPAPTFAALSGAANRSGRSLEALARDLLERSIAAPQTSGQVSSPPMQLQQTQAAPMQLQQPQAAPMPLTMVVKGGAAAEPPAEPTPIPLTPKHAAVPVLAPAPAPTPMSDAESGWFKRR